MPETTQAVENESELSSPRWSVVSFDRREAVGLTYEQATAKLAELENQKMSGLCILTDEAASRMET